MANQKQASTKRLKMSERAQKQLELLFPEVPSQWIWRRKTNDGYTTLPRTLPLVMQAVDDQSKGQPAGHTLFCLWARSPDHPLVSIENPATFASEAGFEGERAVDTWRRRMKRLQALQLIFPKSGPSGDFHYVLLLNPNVGMEHMNRNKMEQSRLYARFTDRVIEVGGYGDVEAVRLYWQQQSEATKVAAQQGAATSSAPLPVPTSPSAEDVPAPPQPSSQTVTVGTTTGNGS